MEIGGEFMRFNDFVRASLSNDIIAKCNSSVIEYHLDDDTIKQYKLYYIPNEDKYMNIRLQK